jgi:nucleotide-binding universal stress UspA family protein
MYRRILLAVGDYEQAESLLELVKDIRTEGVTEVRALHLRLHELAGMRPFTFARESREDATLAAEATAFELRMAGIGASSVVGNAYFDRVAEAIVDDATRFAADLIVLGSPRRRELAARVFGSVTQRVLLRTPCPVLVASRQLRDGSGGLSKSPRADF